MAYEFDIFLSYSHNFEEWTQQYFLRFLKRYLKEELTGEPSIYLDSESTFAGDAWPERIRKSLAVSRCLVAVWSPSYFRSRWCWCECSLMLHREHEEGYRTKRKPTGLVLPVIVHGEIFPPFTDKIQHLDCRDFVFEGDGFQKSELYIQFQSEMKSWVKQVARAIKQAPRWRRKWLNYAETDVPKAVVGDFKPPLIA